MQSLFEFIEKNPTVTVSIGAAFFTFLTTIIVTYINARTSRSNLERQLKFQLATSHHKEWVNEVRTNVGKVIMETTNLIALYRTDTENQSEQKESIQTQRGVITDILCERITNLSLLLDKRKAKEEILITKMNQLLVLIQKENFREEKILATLESLLAVVIYRSIELFDSKFNLDDNN